VGVADVPEQQENRGEAFVAGQRGAGERAEGAFDPADLKLSPPALLESESTARIAA